MPVLDITSPLQGPCPDWYWALRNTAHNEFVAAEPNRVALIAEGSGHYIFEDNPALIINAISKAYIETLEESQQKVHLEKALDTAIELAIEAKKTEVENKHSESDLNDWGYALLRGGEMDKALHVFKLNTILFPDSWNVYDSYGEVLVQANRKIEAIEMYKKSLVLNPENEHAKMVLLRLKEE